MGPTLSLSLELCPVVTWSEEQVTALGVSGTKARSMRNRSVCSSAAPSPKKVLRGEQWPVLPQVPWRPQKEQEGWSPHMWALETEDPV